MYSSARGFTINKVMVTIAIIGILASIIGINVNNSRQLAADKERQAKVLEVEAALERYRLDHGRYPEACAGGVYGWVGQQGSEFECDDGTNNYIQELAPNYMPHLPFDDRVNDTGAGYVYSVNDDGSTYKFMSRMAAERDVVTFDSELAHCDLNDYNNDGNGLCENVSTCTETNLSFQTSYAVWGGFSDNYDAVRELACSGGETGDGNVVPPYDIVRVSAIEFSFSGGKNGNNNLKARVLIVDAYGDAVSGVSVSGTLENNVSGVIPVSGITSNGVVNFQKNKADCGTWTLTIDEVSLTGAVWDNVPVTESAIKLCG